MSVTASCAEGWVISHERYISKIYKGKFRLRPSLFNINHPYKVQKKTCEKLDPLALKLKQKLDNLIKSVDIKLDQNILSQNFDQNDEDTLNVAEECSKITNPLRNVNCSLGGNNSRDIIIHNINSCDVIFPENCCFMCGDIKEKISKVSDKFDLIILDPPWWNKYIRRKKAKDPDSSYKMLYNDDIVNLPISELTNSGTIIAVWCTNSSLHELSIRNAMFPKWGVTFVATWYWIKITKQGQPVCPFSKTNGKQPFERVIIGVRDALPNQSIPDIDKIFASVPSALHSHKPPLNDLLAPYLNKKNPKCLELFARYLLPETTSIGLEPLRWQHSYLYTPLNVNIEENKNNSSKFKVNK